MGVSFGAWGSGFRLKTCILSPGKSLLATTWPLTVEAQLLNLRPSLKHLRPTFALYG